MKRIFSILIQSCAIAMVVLLPAVNTAQQIEQSRWVTTVEWSNVGTLLALGWSDGTLEIVDGVTEQSVWSANAHKTASSVINWSYADDRIVTGDLDGNIVVWSSSGDVITLADLAEEPIAALQWLTQGDKILIGLAGFSAPNTALLVDASSGVIVDRLEEPGAHLQFSISPSHGKILSLGIYGFSLWDAYTGKRDQFIGQQVIEVEQTDEIASQLTAVTWSGDGSRIGTANLDGTIRIWNLTNTPEIEREWRTNLPTPYELNIDATERGMSVEIIAADGRLAAYAIDSDVQLVDTYLYSSEKIQHFSPYRGHLVQIARAENLNDLASRDSSDVWSIIVAPASLTRIQSIAKACRRDAMNPTAAEAVLSTPAVNALTNAALPAFITRVEALPAGIIPPACKADLLAVTNALVNPQ